MFYATFSKWFSDFDGVCSNCWSDQRMFVNPQVHAE